ncbi:MAG: hypothetical protein ACRESE_09585 [Gammaproteobacteria bacterium]
MKKIIETVPVILILLVGGCATLPVAQMQEAAIPLHDNVTFRDERTSPSSGSFMFAEGSVYSCHYAIKKIGEGAVHPDRMISLHSYLDNQVFKDNKPHTVTVTRFDIYWNKHVVTEGQVFGLPGEQVSSSGNVIGCKDAQEGEYYGSEVPDRLNDTAIVIYLQTMIDGQKYNVRTVYPIFNDSNAQSKWPFALVAAINKTFVTLDSLVIENESGANKVSTSN